MSWTDERVELLKKMWTEGQSASQIAKTLGGVTRNAVIGKVHRLGMPNRAGVVSPATADDPAAAVETDEPPAAAADTPDHRADEAEMETEAAETSAEPVIADAARPAGADMVPAGQPEPPRPAGSEISPEALATVREAEKRALRLSLMELTERTCKWPVGDPATEDFWFCGLPVQSGKPYCEAHVGLAFQPMNARRDRRR